MGVECYRSGGQFRDSDIAAGVDVGPGPLHVCNRAVQCGPGLVR